MYDLKSQGRRPSSGVFNAFYFLYLLDAHVLFLSLHVAIASLQMVKLCWAHGLYDAIFYVYNRGMHDYTTPLEVLSNISSLLNSSVRSCDL